MTGPWLGIIADDVTGAADVAAAVRAAGHHVALTFPAGAELAPPSGTDCWVVGLTTRHAPVAEAVERTLATARAMRDAGVTVLYQKYCSTFDSTAEGTIGPVADAVLGLAEQDAGPDGSVMVHTPATPRSGRTVRDGQLWVDDQLLADSPMRDHPLTPMTDSDLVRLLARQSTRPVRRVSEQTDDRAWTVAVVAATGGHVIIDARADTDLDRQASALAPLGDWPQVVTGGAAGWAAALARSRPASRRDADDPSVRQGRRLALAGSCSTATRDQVRAFDAVTLTVTPDEVAAHGPDVLAEQVLGAVEQCWEREPMRPVLVSSAADPAEVARAQRRYGTETVARGIEQCLARIAGRAVAAHRVSHLVVAGGETSGAVRGALDLAAATVLDEIAPGVPWLVTGDGLAVAFKSGNFGGPDFFTAAFDSVP